MRGFITRGSPGAGTGAIVSGVTEVVLTSDAELSPLFAPGRIGAMRLRNRFVQSPIFTQFAEDDGCVGERYVEHMRGRARGGTGLIISENCAVDSVQGRAVGHSIRADDDCFVPGFRVLTAAVHAEGAAIALQLHHAGRQGRVVDGQPLVAPTAGIASANQPPPRGLEAAELPGIVARFAAAARRAVDGGFDAVELHGSHGYLLQQFLSPHTNRRTDEYGGSLANRARFPLAVVRAVRDAIGPGVPLLYRVSVEEAYPPASGIQGLVFTDGLAFCRMLEPLVDAIDVSVGNYDTGPTFVSMGDPDPLLRRAQAVRAEVGVPVIAVGRMSTQLGRAAQAVGSGSIDFIALGRSQLAEGRLPLLAARGEAHRGRPCLACNECAGYMSAGVPVRCVVNPELGRDVRVRELSRPARHTGQVLVVGGGPAGCEAALVAARRGHEVVLAEAAGALGGQLRAWSAGFLGAEVARLIAFYEGELAAAGVRVRLLYPVTEQSQLAGFDYVLLASGTVHDAAAAPAGALDPLAVLSGAPVSVLTGAPVTVWGDGEIAAQAALVLARRGEKVRLRGPGERFAVDTNRAQGGTLTQLLLEAGVELEPGAATQSAERDATFVWAGPRVPSAVLAEAEDGHRVRAIGSRLGGRLEQATSSGYWTAAALGEE